MTALYSRASYFVPGRPYSLIWNHKSRAKNLSDIIHTNSDDKIAAHCSRCCSPDWNIQFPPWCDIVLVFSRLSVPDALNIESISAKKEPSHHSVFGVLFILSIVSSFIIEIRNKEFCSYIQARGDLTDMVASAAAVAIKIVVHFRTVHSFHGCH